MAGGIIHSLRRIYPSRGRLLFDGGLNNKFERTIIEDNESPDCANVIFTAGAVETREGRTKLNSTAIGSFAGDGIYTRHDNDGSETMCVFAGSDLRTWSGSTFVTVASAQSVFTAGNRVAATEFQNYLFMGNGGVTPYKYDGSEFTRHGVYAPETTATVASAATGASLSSGASYTYRFTFVNSQLVEGDLGPAVTHVVAANSMGNAALTSIPTAAQSWGVDARRIYRTEDGGSTFKLLATLSDNSTTSYEDAIDDSALGANAPTDNGVPPLYSVCVYHQNRLFVNDPANPNLVWYSELNEPFTFKSTNFIRIGDKSGKLVETMAVYENSVVVGTSNNYIEMIYMPSTDPTEWSQIRVDSAYGSKSPFGWISFNNQLLFPAMENDKFVGFSSLRGAANNPSVTFTTLSTVGSDLLSTRIEDDMFLIMESLVGDISAITFKNKAYISVPYGSGATRNNRLYVMDYSIGNLRKRQKESWSPWTNIDAAQMTIYAGNLYYVSSKADGFVYQLEDGTYNDDDAAIDSYYWTKEYSGVPGDENFNKDFRYANLLVEKLGAYNMNLTYRTNSDAGDGTAVQIDLDPGGNQWGSLEWGTDEWGGGVEQEDKRVFLGTLRGKRIQFKFSNQNTADQAFKVHGMNIVYNLKGYR